MEDFIWRALAAGIGVALVTGVLGCFVVWRRMAYFSDSLAHSTLLGIALGLQLGISLTLATIAVCLCFAALLLWIQSARALATDTILGILAHAMLAFGLVAISFNPMGTLDLHAFLFGDILTVSGKDLAWLYGGGALVLGLLAWHWQPLLLSTINADIAAAEGASTLRLRIVLIVLMTVTVAVSIQIIGVLLIASLLIIPAASARLLAKSPEMMAVLAVLFGIAATVVGLQFSLVTDAPAGPAIVAAAAVLFGVAAVVGGRGE